MASTLLPPLRRCGKCRELKSEDAFYKKPSGAPVSYCRPCDTARAILNHASRRARQAAGGAWKQWPHVSKDQYLRAYAARTTFKRKFCLTLHDYCELLNGQRGRCKICHKTEPVPDKNLAVDHCHATGKVRGLLCSKCNLGIGHLGDTAEALERALAYLRSAA